MAGVAVERVLQKLGGVKSISKHPEDIAAWIATCPAHNDAKPSLHISERADHSVGLHCHAGCDKFSILGELGLTLADLFEPKSNKKQILATYDYYSLDGTLLYQVVRFWPKEFRQRRPDGNGGWKWDMAALKGKHVPYQLPKLKGQSVVVVVEGEKDADKLWKLGIPATTNSGGAKKWGASESKALKQAGVQRVIVLPDNDLPGADHAVLVGSSVKEVGLAVNVIELPHLAEHGDVSDWLDNGGTKEDLVALFAVTPHIVPKGAQPVPVEVPDIPAAPDALPDPLNYKIGTTVGAGAAEAFRDRYKDRLRYDHTRRQWFVWDQHRWKRDIDEEVMRLALKHSRQWGQEVIGAAPTWEDRKRWETYTLKLERRPDRVAMLADAQALKPFKGTPQWDANPWLLGVPNGVVNLKTGELRDGQPSDLITLHAGVAYEPDADCPRWLQFLDEVFEDPAIIEFVQRFCGYCLTGRTSEQILVMCYGKGRNGKGRLLTALRGVLGEYSAVLPFSSLIQSRKGHEASNDLAAIQGKRLVTASEVNEGARLNEARIKALTGEDPITARFLYAEFGTFDPMAKYILAVNSKPVVRDDSDGFWRRVRLIPFEKQFKGEDCDPDLDAKLELEWPGILAWTVQGCLDWQHGGRLPEPAAIMEATHEYELDSDPLEDFLNVECEDRSGTSPVTETGNAMFTAYVGWCETTKRSKEDRLTSTAFGLALSKKFKKAREGGRVIYYGLRLKPRKSHLPYDDD